MHGQHLDSISLITQLAYSAAGDALAPIQLPQPCLVNGIQNFGQRNLACMVYQIKSICKIFLGLPSSVPAYLDAASCTIDQLAMGVSFASGGTGLDDLTADTFVSS